MKKIIIINGPPASGKTTILNRLLGELQWEVVTKDDIKEKLLAGLGELSPYDNRQLSEQVFHSLFEVVSGMLKEEGNLLVEGNFKSRFSVEFKALLNNTNYSVLQIFCHANSEVLISRYKDRMSGEERHFGHEKTLDMESVRETGQTTPLDIKAELIDYDNSNGETFDYESVVRWAHTE